MKTAAANVPALAQFEALRRWLDEPVVAGGNAAGGKSKPGHGRRRQRQKLVSYKSPPTNAVRVAHRLPKHGRSSWLSGLLRGPWG